MQYTNLHEGNTYKLQTCMQYTYLHEGNTYKLIFFKGPQKASPQLGILFIIHQLLDSSNYF